MLNFKEMDVHKWKGHFINELIKKNKFSSYLELGIGNSDTWNIVECQIKKGVDMDLKFMSSNDTIHCETTDAFFKKNNLSLIYIDASHDKFQTKRDFINSLNFINENGIILFHDINPINERETYPSSSGNVYELLILMDKYFNLNTVFGDKEDTLGILMISRNPHFQDKIDDFLLSDMIYGYEYFNKQRTELIYQKNIYEI